jgi:hypothetical protein
VVGASSARSGLRRPDSETDEWAPRDFNFVSNLSKTVSTLKIKIGALSCSKNSQFLHVTRLGYYEQCSQLCRHPIPNIIGAKNPGSDSTFESLKNFKRGLNLPEKSAKFSKILS